MTAYGLAVPPSTHGDVVESLCRDGSLTKAIEYYRSHKSSNTCGSLIRGVAEKGKFEIALKVFENFKETDESEFVYSEIIKAAGDECKKAMVGEGSWEERLSKAAQVSGFAASIFDSIPPASPFKNVVVCNSMIRCYGEAHLVSSAFDVYAGMKEANVEPTMVTFGSLAAACERCGAIERVGALLEELRELGLTPNEFVYGR